MKIEVRPIPRKKWHGKTGKEDFARTQVITPLYDTSLGGYATGLDYSKKGEKKIKELQTHFIGERLDNMYDPEKPHPFWESERFHIKLPNSTKFFNDEDELQKLQIGILKASKFIANSMMDYEEGLYPEATHVIFDEEEQVEIKSKKAELRFNAVAIAMKMSPEEKINIVQILGEKSVRKQSSSYVLVEVEKLIEKNPEMFMKYATMDKEQMTLKATVLEAIHRGILRKEQGGSVFYYDEKLGFDLDSSVEYFSKVDNQQLKIKILEKLNE